MKDKLPLQSAGRMPVVVALFGSREAAERRIGGVATAARIVGEACRAGAPELWLVLEEREQLSFDALDDVERACGGRAQLRWLNRAELAAELPGAQAELVMLGDAMLVVAETLAAFIASGEAELRAHGSVAARRLDPLGQPLPSTACLAIDDEARVIPLGEPARARRLLLKRTGKKTDGIVSRWINRPISQAITALLCEFRAIRPSHLTFATALIGAAMFLALALGGPSGLVVGGLLFQLASLIDGVDGELARLTYRSSPRGAAFDTSVDMATNIAFFIGLTIGLGRIHGLDYVELGATGLLAMVAGVVGLGFLTRRSADPTSFDLLKHFYGERYSSGAGAAVAKVLKSVFSRDLFAFVFALMLVVGLAPLVLWIFAVAAILWLLLLLAAAPSLLFSQAAVGRRG